MKGGILGSKKCSKDLIELHAFSRNLVVDVCRPYFVRLTFWN